MKLPLARILILADNGYEFFFKSIENFLINRIEEDGYSKVSKDVTAILVENACSEENIKEILVHAGIDTLEFKKDTFKTTEVFCSAILDFLTINENYQIYLICNKNETDADSFYKQIQSRIISMHLHKPTKIFVNS